MKLAIIAIFICLSVTGAVGFLFPHFYPMTNAELSEFYRFISDVCGVHVLLAAGWTIVALLRNVEI